MIINLIDLQKSVIDAWTAELFKSDPETLKIFKFVIKQGSIFDYPTDAIVSPANSFGFMTGGIDLPLVQFMGGEPIQNKVHQIIQDQFNGSHGADYYGTLENLKKYLDKFFCQECGKLQDTEIETKPCPYQEEINSKEYFCQCCQECTQRCLWEI